MSDPQPPSISVEERKALVACGLCRVELDALRALAVAAHHVLRLPELHPAERQGRRARCCTGSRTTCWPDRGPGRWAGRASDGADVREDIAAVAFAIAVSGALLLLISLLDGHGIGFW